MGITNPEDLDTLQDFIAQTNIDVEEVSEAKDEDVEVDTEEKSTVNDNNSKSGIKIVQTIEDDSDIDLDRLHITDENDKSTLEDLMAQENFQVDEMVPVDSNQQGDSNQNTSPVMKVVETIEDDDSDINFDRMHINDENDRSTLEDLLAQDNVQVDEVVPITDAQALEAGFLLTSAEGIIPALESAHALAVLEQVKFSPDETVVVNVSGRGDKDLDTYIAAMNK